MKRNKKKTPRNKMPFKKGDQVIALSGADAVRGKQGKPGKVLQMLPKQQKAIVEGFNYVKKHMRKTQDQPQGGIAKKEAPIHVSNLMKFVGDAAKKPSPDKA